MLLLLAQWLSHYAHVFSVFQYLTLRAIFSVVTSLLLVLFIGPFVIRRLAERHIGEKVRDLDQLTNHHGKK